MFKRRRNRKRQNSSSAGSCEGLTPQELAGSSVGSGSTTTTRNGLHNNREPASPKILLKGGASQNGIKNGGGSSKADGSLESQTASTRSSSHVKHVRFANVEIREYERILANNPSCSSGAPVGIGWEYGSLDKIALDEYEYQKPKKRTQVDLVLSRQEREAILLEWGATFTEIVDQIRSNIRTKNQRRHTVNTLGRYDKWEEMLESASRKFKRTLLLQKTAGQRARELSAQVQTTTEIVCEECKEEAMDHSSQSTENMPHHHHHHHHHHHNHSNRQLVSNPSQKSMGSNQHSSAAPEAAPEGQEPENRAARTLENGPLQSSDRHDSMSLGASGHDGLPLLEVDVYQGTDVSTRFTYDEDMTIQTNEFDEDDDDDLDYDDDGFGLLVRDTRHWFVNGHDGPQIQRRMIPLVITEDTNHNGMGQHQMLYQQPGMVMTEQQWLYQGYGMQPPPYSQAMAIHWE